MSTKSITGTGLLLAVALLAQSLRLMFPFIPNQVSMFLIGSITSATFVLATWRYGWKNGLVIAWIAPVVAHLQGMLPLPPFILITGLGTTAYVLNSYYFFFIDLRIKPPTDAVIPKPNRAIPIVCIKMLV